MYKNKTFNHFLIIVFVILNAIEATLSPKTNKDPKVKFKNVNSGPINKTVFDLNLVTRDPTAREIIKNNQAYFRATESYNVEGISLGYVTPWNNHGYDIAKIFANKFTHISPVWLQLKRTNQVTYEIGGLHDIDENWMKELVKAGRKRHVKIVPRIVLEGWTSRDFNVVFERAEEAIAIAKTLAKLCTSWKFKGFVLEGWSSLFGHVNVTALVDVIKSIATRLTNNKCQTILVIPPMRQDDKFNLYTRTVFDELYNDITAFSLMTYDFSSVQRPGPNSPILWVEASVKLLSPGLDKRKKILTGLNFYGNAYTPNGGDAIIGKRYLELLKKFKGKMPYDSNSAENYFEIKDDYHRFIVFYPTLYSINERIKLIKMLGTGISIWELGQGLDYFYDLI